MITDRVIKEIYKKYNKAAKSPEELNLNYFIEVLKPNHHIKVDNNEVIFEDQEEFSPFRRFLIRSLNGVLEFDRQVAFVFNNHILFLGKENGDMRIHMKPFEEKSHSCADCSDGCGMLHNA